MIMSENYLEKPSNEYRETQTIYLRQDERQTNGIGIAGFVLAIIAIFVGWVPFIGWLVWALGALFSFIGIFKSPRGLAIAGLAISFVGLIFMIFVFGVLLLASGAN